MNILLIQPPSQTPLMDQVYLFEPLALEYLGAGVQLDGHRVRLHDARLDPDIERAVREFRPDVVGLTAFTSHLNIVRALAASIRRLSPGTFLVIGGHHATVVPEDFNDSAFDLVVIGEGVMALREILRELAGARDFRTISGLGLPDPLVAHGLRDAHDAHLGRVAACPCGCCGNPLADPIDIFAHL